MHFIKNYILNTDWTNTTYVACMNHPWILGIWNWDAQKWLDPKLRSVWGGRWWKRTKEPWYKLAVPHLSHIPGIHCGVMSSTDKSHAPIRLGIKNAKGLGERSLKAATNRRLNKAWVKTGTPCLPTCWCASYNKKLPLPATCWRLRLHKFLSSPQRLAQHSPCF